MDHSICVDDFKHIELTNDIFQELLEVEQEKANQAGQPMEIIDLRSQSPGNQTQELLNANAGISARRTGQDIAHDNQPSELSSSSPLGPGNKPEPSFL